MGFAQGDRGAEPTDAELLAQVSPEDLLQYGLIPEFVGRLPVVARWMTLDERH